jgi:hypothetical protein
VAVNPLDCVVQVAGRLAYSWPPASHGPPAGDPADRARPGRSTSVGGNAIRLAVAAGYDVITTASPRNADYVT